MAKTIAQMPCFVSRHSVHQITWHGAFRLTIFQSAWWRLKTLSKLESKMFVRIKMFTHSFRYTGAVIYMRYLRKMLKFPESIFILRQNCMEKFFKTNSVVRRPPSAVRRPSSAVRRPPSVVRRPPSAVRRPPFTYTRSVGHIFFSVEFN